MAGALALLALIVGGALIAGREEVFPAKDEAPADQTKSADTSVKRQEAHEAAPPPPSVVPVPPSADASPTLEEQQTDFDEAMTAGTVEALDAFANKYPKSKLAKTAKRMSESIARQQAATKAKSRGAETKPEPTPFDGLRSRGGLPRGFRQSRGSGHRRVR